MQIETKYLKPGMILLEDVLGKSNKPIIEKRTVLTEKHIEFLEKFMITWVTVTPFQKSAYRKRKSGAVIGTAIFSLNLSKL